MDAALLDTRECRGTDSFMQKDQLTGGVFLVHSAIPSTRKIRAEYLYMRLLPRRDIGGYRRSSGTI